MLGSTKMKFEMEIIITSDPALLHGLNGEINKEAYSARRGLGISNLRDGAGAVYIIGRIDGQDVGGATLSNFCDQSVELSKLYVIPTVRGRRIGEALVRAAFAVAQDRAVTIVQIEIAHGSLPFWEQVLTPEQSDIITAAHVRVYLDRVAR